MDSLVIDTAGDQHDVYAASANENARNLVIRAENEFVEFRVVRHGAGVANHWRKVARHVALWLPCAIMRGSHRKANTGPAGFPR